MPGPAISWHTSTSQTEHAQGGYQLVRQAPDPAFYFGLLAVAFLVCWFWCAMREHLDESEKGRRW